MLIYFSLLFSILICFLVLSLIYASDPIELDITILLKPQHENLAIIEPTQFDFKADSAQNQTVTVTGAKPGHLEVTADSQPNQSWM